MFRAVTGAFGTFGGVSLAASKTMPMPRALDIISLHALLEHRIGQVSDAVFDGVVELQFGFCFGSTLAIR
jgi:hypothetical protein